MENKIVKGSFFLPLLHPLEQRQDIRNVQTGAPFSEGSREDTACRRNARLPLFHRKYQPFLIIV